MKLQLIRSATLRIEYARRRFVIDPYLAAKHAMPSYTGASPNPLVELPCPPEEVVSGIEMAIISHLHSDHFDPTAQRLLPKSLPILCQPGDQAGLSSKGFHNLLPVTDAYTWQGITFTRIDGQHGTGQVLQDMGNASGFLLQAENEPTVYWVGDSIWCDAVANTIAEAQPDVIVTHSNGAMWGDSVLIVMDAVQTVAVCQAAPDSTVVATHMDSLDHGTVSRKQLRAYAKALGIRSEQLLIPEDGEMLAVDWKKANEQRGSPSHLGP